MYVFYIINASSYPVKICSRSTMFKVCNPKVDIFSSNDTKTSFENLWNSLVHVIWDEVVANS